MEGALREMGLDTAIISAIHDLLDEDASAAKPSRAFLRDTKAMRATPADVIETPESFEYVVDMPGLKSDHIKVHIEDDGVLVVSGERRRRREEEGGGVKYLKMERRLGKLLKKFVLPENADKEKVTAAYEEGVLTVTVAKRAPPQPKKPNVIEVKICSGGGGGKRGGE